MMSDLANLPLYIRLEKKLVEIFRMSSACVFYVLLKSSLQSPRLIQSELDTAYRSTPKLGLNSGLTSGVDPGIAGSDATPLGKVWGKGFKALRVEAPDFTC
jgi:hypothetical protein